MRRTAQRLNSDDCRLSPVRRATHRTPASRTASALRAVEIPEAVGKRYHYISSECIVSRFQMIVRFICHGKILRLIENIVCLDSKSQPVFQEKFVHLGIENDFIFLRRSIAVVPVIVNA